MSATDLLVTLRRRGLALSVVAGKLVVQPATALAPADREDIRAHLPALVAILTVEREQFDRPEPEAGAAWDQHAAHRLMFEADALVEALGVNGRCPEIDTAAEAVYRAHVAHDPRAFRNAIERFVTTVHRLGTM
ncbi:unnamed protein product [Gemmata massiliana]|uniref:TubC N-terminal docking domain-containing protein n=1 Tax=Gemmata massiliana TaxID=1210884 RepID=A0A6P2DHF2_9BACT|nr:hypothetical protein [Gemmata massiliana]VTS01848.1 unnamed protein product [Gemmata massiliana]